jgi:hypothetical protein
MDESGVFQERTLKKHFYFKNQRLSIACREYMNNQRRRCRYFLSKLRRDETLAASL